VNSLPTDSRSPASHSSNSTLILEATFQAEPLPALKPEEKYRRKMSADLGRLPSWNDVLSLEPWALYKYKQDLENAMLSELRQSADGSSMRIICARSFLLTCSDTLARYREMRLAKRRLKLLNKKQAKASQKKSGLKSLNSDVPF